MEFCQWLLRHHEQLDRILFTDEYTFNTENTINMYNLHMWSLKNPHAIFERSFQHHIAINQWCTHPLGVRARKSGGAKYNFTNSKLNLS